MAKAYFNTEGFITQIATDSDANNLNINKSDYVEKTLSDEDFSAVRQGLKKISLSGDTVNLVEDNYTFPDQTTLSNYINKVVIPALDQFLESNEEHPMWTAINNYKFQISEQIDLSTITYPLNSTWEKYCEDNSITYYHPLQIP
jgi:hypothetical protein|tara:strand:+ start:153 stop:584 length:432 start_codon:yes stop_codon:yes gene_type:complete